jgi:HTH-type transcriptional regulator/antitoxin HigA
MTAIFSHATEEEYLALVRAFPLISIGDDERLSDALEVIDQLIEKRERSIAEDAYLSALTDLVETYENTHVEIPPMVGVDALRYLMEENGLKQSDLVPLFGSPSIISEVLSGKRPLALSHMKRLATHFGVPVSVFIEPDSHAVAETDIGPPSPRRRP